MERWKAQRLQKVVEQLNVEHLYLCISGYARKQMSLVFHLIVLESSVTCNQDTN